jgi:hypothetical protein
MMSRLFYVVASLVVFALVFGTALAQDPSGVEASSALGVDGAGTAGIAGLIAALVALTGAVFRMGSAFGKWAPTFTVEHVHRFATDANPLRVEIDRGGYDEPFEEERTDGGTVRPKARRAR